ncbi:MAG: hypothetical protein U1F35_04510 [Steroidobacteraceae bacterium]
MKPTPPDWPRISSSLYYRDAAAAIDWLCRAFGFTIRLRIEGADGSIEHSELEYGEDYWADRSYGALDLEDHLWWFTQRLRSRA